ncbi:hypothetical protein BRADI_1g37953v3 [Brachypodium distachyon]|uniref:Uncharacterized protein n=1 Tax=Brachypodium distachyon TaxID=15368 RepID=A0A0Q3H560_BRADI|nr:hypothetical protein BRADI_1g37953v3 [Brachypodium distachyon]
MITPSPSLAACHSPVAASGYKLLNRGRVETEEVSGARGIRATLARRSRYTATTPGVRRSARSLRVESVVRSRERGTVPRPVNPIRRPESRVGVDGQDDMSRWPGRDSVYLVDERASGETRLCAGAISTRYSGGVKKVS